MIMRIHARSKAKVAAREKRKKEIEEQDLKVGKLVRRFSNKIFRSGDLPEDFKGKLKEIWEGNP